MVKGRRETVATYLERCRALWPAGDAQLSKWIGTVKAGGTPDWDAVAE